MGEGVRVDLFAQCLSRDAKDNNIVKNGSLVKILILSSKNIFNIKNW